MQNEVGKKKGFDSNEIQLHHTALQFIACYCLGGTFIYAVSFDSRISPYEVNKVEITVCLLQMRKCSSLKFGGLFTVVKLVCVRPGQTFSVSGPSIPSSFYEPIILWEELQFTSLKYQRQLCPMKYYLSRNDIQAYSFLYPGTWILKNLFNEEILKTQPSLLRTN